MINRKHPLMIAGALSTVIALLALTHACTASDTRKDAVATQQPPPPAAKERQDATEEQTKPGDAAEEPRRNGKRRGTGRSREDAAPKVGDEAPLFKLKRFDDQTKEVELAAFRGKKPVVLFFGSYT